MPRGRGDGNFGYELMLRDGDHLLLREEKTRRIVLSSALKGGLILCFFEIAAFVNPNVEQKVLTLMRK
jgi:hypothetical protein